ncbi:hypothetical protein RND81_10G192300 [Saponaria officinalis]|uniref:WD repeat-containing protein 44 n=1 Tax=Saponaria officinalis TaxID=3572 RepID=A0AAW1I6D9_SAPOF
MEMKRTMTMTWDGLDDDDFFDSNNRISAVVPMDFLAVAPGSSDSSDDEFEDPRMSFASVMAAPSPDGGARLSSVSVTPMPPLPSPSDEGYDVWMAAPTSIQERRRRLLQGMGLNSSKELIRLRTMAMSKKVMGANAPPLPPSAGGGKGVANDAKKVEKDGSDNGEELKKDGVGGDVDGDDDLGSPSGSPDTPLVLVRSRSDGDIDQFSIETKKRKEQLIGNVSKQKLTRTLSTLAPFTRLCKLNYDSVPNSSGGGNGGDNDGNVKAKKGKRGRGRARGNHKKSGTGSTAGEQLGAFFLIKNLDTGKEFIVKEFNEDGMWKKFSDLQTGKQLTMEEFEQSVGYSPVVKELMRRENRGLNGGADGGGAGLERKTSVNAFMSKSFRYSKRRGVSLLKNINRVANSVTGGIGAGHEKDHPSVPATPVAQVVEPPPKAVKAGANPQNSEWVRVRTQGKAHKELTALRFCQEIQAHEGSIWAMKFSVDGRYLASAGEDKVIHIWEVQECEIASLRPPDDTGNSTPLHPMFCPSPDRDKPPLAPDLSALDKKKKGKLGSRKGGIMPDYVKLPETVFSLSSDPVCSFVGHLDDVLDLSWSSQMHLLSSSMDKTVRLWDMETKACLKLFAHNDYVTCIQFNPVNDDYFISGSLDAKVRVWSVPGRRVVDWTDLHEMVTAACYTPDGQGAAVGSHKGLCRMYSITDGKLNQLSQFDIQNKKKAAPKKITGFQFMPENPNEVLVTSADSRIRIYDGSDVIQKFRGFRNTSSQIAASFSPDGKYVICGSEDSNVYVWKREEPKNGKTKTTIDTKSYEQFQCKDVSLAIPWPGSVKFEPPTIPSHAKKNSKRSTTPQAPTSATNSPKKLDTNKNSKRHLPPLPNNKKHTSPADKPDNDQNNNDNNDENVEGEKAPDSPESDPSKITRTESGIDESFNSGAGGSIRYGDSPSISSNHSPSPSWSSGWSWFDGGSHGGDQMQARAWGLVIVTAGLGGEIRAYQNFGVPLRVGRQTNLF